jgi:hypothetical protein
MTTVRTAVETAETQLPVVTDPKLREALNGRIGDWKKTAARYDSEPETQEGRKELSARAKAAEAKRDRAMAAWIAGALGVVALAFCVIGLAAPTAVHLF